MASVMMANRIPMMISDSVFIIPPIFRTGFSHF